MFGHNNKLDPSWLATIGFFRDLERAELEAVSTLGERVDVAAGTELIDQGRFGDHCYVIVTGTAGVYIRDEFVTTVGPGTMVGEMALVERRPRTATVLAETDLVLVSFGIEEFHRLLERSPTAQARVMATLNERLRDNQSRL
jgi:CRP/FNR family transcriptional regulator, cyclic AMP receptor protein